jgi:ferredoxin
MKKLAIILLFILPVLGGLCGYGAGPFLARAHWKVRLARRIAREDALGLTELTKESEAFRETGDSTEELYEEAGGIQKTMRMGGALLGVWFGLVIAAKLNGLTRPRRREAYEINHARCVACARCFEVCPFERDRREEQAQWQS